MQSERQHPSSSVSPTGTDKSSIRRRSTKIPKSSSAYDVPPGLLAGQRQYELPTRSHTFAQPSTMPHVEPSSASSATGSSGAEIQLETFNNIPLTPQPRGSPLGEDAALPPSLPAPEFARKTSSGTHSFLSHGLGFLSTAAHQPFFSSRSSRDTRPASARSDTNLSSSSHSSSSSHLSVVSFASVDSGHNSIISSVGASRKFTHKWPRPYSVNRQLSRQSSFLSRTSSQAAAMALEEGSGLGLERIERWTIHKWCLLISVATVFAYGMAGLVCALSTWFRTWQNAGVTYVADYDILVLITLAGAIAIFASFVGICGTLLNSRPILAIYALLLWPSLIAILAVGYTSYKRATFSLDRKLDFAWSQWYTPLGRLIIQDSLRCCGYFDALHEATPSKTCYTRTPLPGCKARLYGFELTQLANMWSAAFSLVPLHIAAIFVSLLCADHVTETFGKGTMPRGYWLKVSDVREDAERIVKVLRRPGLAKASSSSSSRVFREDKHGV